MMGQLTFETYVNFCPKLRFQVCYSLFPSHFPTNSGTVDQTSNILEWVKKNRSTCVDVGKWKLKNRQNRSCPSYILQFLNQKANNSFSLCGLVCPICSKGKSQMCFKCCVSCIVCIMHCLGVKELIYAHRW